ncbi:MAG: hypothetical protein R3F39_20365 [Myxococcota bacterium]
MQHLVRRSGQLVSPTGKPAVRATDSTVHTLDAAAAAVWFAADGERDAAALLAELRTVEALATQERLFSLLDQLSEQGIVEGRLAPPTDGLDRRGLFRRFAFGAAAAVVAAPVLAQAGKARAATSEICLDDMAFHGREMAAKKAHVQLAKELAGEMKEKQKLDEEAAELKQTLEQRVKSGKDTAAVEKKISKEQTAKQDSYQQERELKAKKVSPGGDAAQESKAKDVTRSRRFGVGRSAVFVDLPNGEVFEGLIELSDVVMGGDEKGCKVYFTFIESGLSVSGGNLEVFEKAVLDAKKSGAALGFQWGTEGEFAALGTVVDGRREIVGFDAATGKPRSGTYHLCAQTELYGGA